MIEVDFNLIGKAKAQEIADALLGRPTENRVVLAVDVKEKKTQSGLFIPGTEEKELPRKGFTPLLLKKSRALRISNILYSVHLKLYTLNQILKIKILWQKKSKRSQPLR